MPSIRELKSRRIQWSLELVEGYLLQEKGQTTPLSKYNAWAFVFMIVFFILRLCGAGFITMAHEYYHAIGATLVGNTIVSITAHKVIWTGPGSDLLPWAIGYWGELVVFGIVAIAVPYRIIGKACLGMLGALIFEAPGSYDFIHAATLAPANTENWIFAWALVFIIALVRLFRSGVIEYPKPPDRMVQWYKQEKPAVKRPRALQLI